MGSNFVFGGCDTVALAEKYGTPLYVVSEESIIEKCQSVQNDFLKKYDNTMAVYASKAFLTMNMCKIVEREGLGLDVVSGGECYTAIKAGFPMEKVMFHGNNKSYDELELAITNGVGRIVVDNIREVDMIDEIAEKNNKEVKILFRITPEVKGDTHEYIFTGQKDSKFGIPLEHEIIRTAIGKAEKAQNVVFKGFHFHVGSQLFENNAHTSAIKTLVKLMQFVKEELGIRTEELNVGGGFGIKYTDSDQPKPLSYFIDAIMETVQTACSDANLDRPKMIIEPGRWIVGEAGITLYTIGAIKSIPNVRTYVSVDGGMTDNPRPALYQAEYRALIANKADETPDTTVRIAGKCCESGDILIKEIDLPKPESGDILAVFSTGAYTYSMSSNYNGLCRPPVVLVNKGEDRLMVKRQTYDNLLENEIFEK